MYETFKKKALSRLCMIRLLNKKQIFLKFNMGYYYSIKKEDLK